LKVPLPFRKDTHLPVDTLHPLPLAGRRRAPLGLSPGPMGWQPLTARRSTLWKGRWKRRPDSCLPAGRRMPAASGAEPLPRRGARLLLALRLLALRLLALRLLALRLLALRLLALRLLALRLLALRLLALRLLALRLRLAAPRAPPEASRGSGAAPRDATGPEPQGRTMPGKGWRPGSWALSTGPPASA
jgi:hypothetical protein